MNVALTIAGSDSGGGAGIQADLAAFRCFGVFGTSAITAVTAQNTLGVRAWEPVSPSLIRAQIDAVAEDLSLAAFKTGMLGSSAGAHAVADAIAANSLRNYVLDPVLVASSGERLSDDDALSVIRRTLLPLAALVTPNLDEASALTGQRVQSVNDAARAAEILVRDFGAGAALVTGGHRNESEEIVDVLFAGELRFFRAERIQSVGIHGTGCALSAGITAGLANGDDLEAAVTNAIAYVRAGIGSARALGHGAGLLGFAAQRPARNSKTSD